MRASSLLPIFLFSVILLAFAVPMVFAVNDCGNSCGGGGQGPPIGSFSYTTTVTRFTNITATSTTLSYDATKGSQSTLGFDYMIVLLIGPAVLLGGITKSMAGGIFGATLGITIGALPPPQGPGFFPLFMIPAMCLVMLAMIFFSRRGGSL